MSIHLCLGWFGPRCNNYFQMLLSGLTWSVILLTGQSWGTVVKCCAPSEIFSNSSCVDAKDKGDLWQPTIVYRAKDDQLANLSARELVNLTVEGSFLELWLSKRNKSWVANCSEVYELEPTEEWRLVEGGMLEHQGYGLTTGYCVDHELHPDGKVDTLVLRCLEGNTTEVKEECLNTQSSHLLVIFTVLGVISLVFLLVTLIVYVTVPDLFNLHGKIVVSNVSSIFLVTSYLLIVYNAPIPQGSTSCAVLGYTGYYTSLAMFAWMTVRPSKV